MRSIFARRPWIDETGRREDDRLTDRILTRWDLTGGALLAAILLCTALLHLLRPGPLHRLSRPMRRLTPGQSS